MVDKNTSGKSETVILYPPGQGLKINRVFTQQGKNPLEGEYDLRTSIIRNRDGSTVFELKNIEVPKNWSQVATDILAQKYFRKAGVPQFNSDGSPLLDANGNQVLGSETSAKQIVKRLAACWRHWGEKYGYFASTEEDGQAFEDEITYMLINQIASPNSPQWFNTGLANSYNILGTPQGHYYVDPATQELKQAEDSYSRPSAHACFIQSVKDDLVNEGGIFDLVVRETRVFKYGSGTGSNFSNLRGKGEKLSGGGTSSGLMSFLKIFDRAAGAIKSGGTTRRAAKMVIVNADHPEIEDYILWKVQEEAKVADLYTGSRRISTHLNKVMKISHENKTINWKENDKLKNAIIDAIADDVPFTLINRALQLVEQNVEKYDSDVFDMHYEGTAYQTVSGQNSNNTVRVPNAFMDAAMEGGYWNLTSRTNGQTMKRLKASELFDKIAFAAWACADPGLQFDDAIQEWHTCPVDGRINASNPCSEFLFLDDSACNLASINLIKFLNEKTGIFEVDKFIHATRLWTIVLEISILMAEFPSKEIA
ncbi:MAG: vitamin B12-dependent ribonucleotide reductase, partial [Candidatus Micrarchaeota archaeon]